MQRVIIFEGPDMTGKTQIAQELSKRLGIPYFKNGSEVKQFLDPKDYFVNTLRYADPFFLSYLQQSRHSVIIDRYTPSEWVYSKVFGRGTDTEALKRSDQALADLGAKIVITWRESYVGRSDDQFPDTIGHEKLQQIHDAYVQFREWTKCESIWLNVDDENLDREVDDVITMLDLAPKPLEFSGFCYDLSNEDLDEDEIEGSPELGYPDPDKDWSDVVWESEEVDE